MVNTIDCIEKSSEDKQRPTESVKDEPVFIVLHIMNANIMQYGVERGFWIGKANPEFSFEKILFLSVRRCMAAHKAGCTSCADF